MIELSTPEKTVVVTAKPWWRSLTVWLNVAGIGAALLTGLLELDFIKSSWNIGVLGVLNVMLRVFKTTQPVTVGGAIVAPIKTIG